MSFYSVTEYTLFCFAKKIIHLKALLKILDNSPSPEHPVSMVNKNMMATSKTLVTDFDSIALKTKKSNNFFRFKKIVQQVRLSKSLSG